MPAQTRQDASLTPSIFPSPLHRGQICSFFGLGSIHPFPAHFGHFCRIVVLRTPVPLQGLQGTFFNWRSAAPIDARAPEAVLGFRLAGPFGRFDVHFILAAICLLKQKKSNNSKMEAICSADKTCAFESYCSTGGKQGSPHSSEGFSMRMWMMAGTSCSRMRVPSRTCARLTLLFHVAPPWMSWLRRM